MIELNPIDDIRRAVDRLGYCATAKEMHWKLLRLLREYGFSSRFEVDAQYYGDGLTVHRGRIDILAERNHDRVGIEVDRNSPRGKSIAKLKGIADLTHRVIVLRTSTADPCPEGIDAVIWRSES